MLCCWFCAKVVCFLTHDGQNVCWTSAQRGEGYEAIGNLECGSRNGLGYRRVSAASGCHARTGGFEAAARYDAVQGGGQALLECLLGECSTSTQPHEWRARSVPGQARGR